MKFGPPTDYGGVEAAATEQIGVAIERTITPIAAITPFPSIMTTKHNEKKKSERMEKGGWLEEEEGEERREEEGGFQ